VQNFKATAFGGGSLLACRGFGGTEKLGIYV
jgi:hypothetical protein